MNEKALETTEDKSVVATPSIEVSESSFDALISQAIDKNVSVETMEKLLAMRKELKAEAAKEAFFNALAGFQADCPIIIKSATGGGEKSYKYQYAPLDVIVDQTKEMIQKHGFSYTIQARFEKEPPAQVAICTIHHIAGHSEESEFRAPIDATGNMNIIQKNASSLTYAKRYAFCNAFGILTGDLDDDAQDAGSPEQGKPPQGKKKPPPSAAGSGHSKEWRELYDAIRVMMNDNDWHGNVKDSQGRVMHLDGLKKGIASITAHMDMESLKRTYDSYKVLLDTAKKQHGEANSP